MKGDFACKKCGARYRLMSFGYGEVICPSCYEGEKKFVFLDRGFWLNRITSLMIRESVSEQREEDVPGIIDYVEKHPELQVTG